MKQEQTSPTKHAHYQKEDSIPNIERKSSHYLKLCRLYLYEVIDEGFVLLLPRVVMFIFLSVAVPPILPEKIVNYLITEQNGLTICGFTLLIILWGLAGALVSPLRKGNINIQE